MFRIKNLNFMRTNEDINLCISAIYYCSPESETDF